MNAFRNAIRAIGVLSCVLVAMSSAQAGIIDDGASDAAHQSLANQPLYDAVGLVKRLNSLSQLVVDSSGILIADNWVLTAAHTEVAKGKAGSTFEIGGQVRNVIEAHQHPNFANDIENGWDIGLLKLDSPISTVTPAELYTDTAASLVGQTLTYVGYGRSGTGSTGDTIAAGTKRAGNNVGDQLGFTLNPGPSQVVYSNNILFADMDAQTGPWGNPLGLTNPISLEYLIALGDSGGGMFIEDGGQHYVAGVNSVLFDYDPVETLGYGDVMGTTTIAAALTWITDTITPAPVIGDLDGDGFVGIDDLNIVLGNWNAGTPPTAGQLTGRVPEPGTLALLAAAGMGLGLRPRR